jgi:hypothetical protein
MAISKTISYQRETREITINGNAGAEFELYVKQGTDYYNWDADIFQSTEKILKNQEIPTNGKYTKSIIIPTVTADTSYDFYIRTLPGTTSSVSTTHEQKIGTLYQKGAKTAEFTATESASTLVVAGGLTGGTLTNTSTTLTQTGTITEDSSKFVYVHSTPSWNRVTGGDWTLSNTVNSTVQWSSGANVKLTYGGGTNVVVGDSVTGRGIIDQITVSAISGDLVTLSAAQNLADGQTLTFSEEAWEIGPLSAEIKGSGTASVTMKTFHNIAKIGIADITCVLDVDTICTVKPNAFPVTDIECAAAGGKVLTIIPEKDCTNYLGQQGDNDGNQATKVYKVHSVPAADLTSSRPTGEFDADGDAIYTTLDFAGTSSVAAGATLTGGTSVGYTSHDLHIVGDKDYFYYKTVDIQSPEQTSSLTQGKISITIV